MAGYKAGYTVIGQPIKTHKLQAYYYEYDRTAEVEVIKRVWIHAKDKGLWTAPRDMKLGETVSGTTVSVNNRIVFVVNYNKKMLEHWQGENNNNMFILFKGKSYKVIAKPDEYTYLKGDIKVIAEMRDDPLLQLDKIEDIYDNVVTSPPMFKQYVGSIGGYVVSVGNYIGVIEA